MFMKNKRGLSPLVATVLLIAFAIALGVVVLNFGESIVTASDGHTITTHEGVSCPEGCVPETVLTGAANSEIVAGEA